MIERRRRESQGMEYAVALHFDHQTEQSVLDLRRSLATQGIASTLGKLKERPHISLAVLPDADPEILVSATRAYAGTISSFAFQLGAVGTFPTKRNVVYLAPVPTERLLKCHEELHVRLADAGLVSSPYYLPGKWIPHCSIEMDIPDQQLGSAIRLCKRVLQPLNGILREIGVVEFLPIKSLGTWPLSGQPL